MPDINDLKLKDKIVEYVLEVFDTMLSMPLSLSERKDIPVTAESRMVGSVNFAGSLSGICSIQVERDFAVAMTAAMLGMEPGEVEDDDEIRDVICEVTNIVAGNLKSFFNDEDLPCVLSPPAMTSGKDFTIEPLNVQKVESCTFDYREAHVYVEVGIKFQEAEAESKTPEAKRQISHAQINALDLKSNIVKTVTELFDTMLDMPITLSEEVPTASLEDIRLVGSVSFAGDAMGSISIQVNHDFARQMAASMLGMEPAEIEDQDEIYDVIGEISNIVGGNLKSTYTDLGLECKLSTPSITTGRDFKIETMDTERYERFAFHYQDQVIFFEVGVKYSNVVEKPISVTKEVNYDVQDPEDTDIAKTDVKAPAAEAATDASEGAAATTDLPDFQDTAAGEDPAAIPESPVEEVGSSADELIDDIIGDTPADAQEAAAFAPAPSEASPSEVQTAPAVSASPEPEELKKLTLAEKLDEYARDVFDTMLSMQLVADDVPDAPVYAEGLIVGTVNFVGRLTGLCNIQVGRDFAVDMAASMLGMTPDELDEEEIRDVICEVTNIIGGNLKSFFNDQNLTCMLSPPAVTSGKEFTIEPLNMQKTRRCRYVYQGHSIVVEVGIKLQEAKTEAKVKRADHQIAHDKINALDLKAEVLKTATDLFDTMLDMTVEPSESVTEADLQGSRVVGSVSFAGEAMGSISFHVSHDFSRQIAAAMLGMEVEDITDQDEVNDVIGEISNIIGGNLKSTYVDLGLECELSTPAITNGVDFKIEAMNTERYERFAVKYNDNIIFLEVGVKYADIVQKSAEATKDIAYQVVDEPATPAEPVTVVEAEADAAGGDGALSAEEIEKLLQEMTSIAEEPAPAPAAAPPPRPVKQNIPPETAKSSGGDVARSPGPAPSQTSDAADTDVISPNLAFLLDIPLEITIELGRTRVKISELLEMGEKSVIELTTLAHEPVNIMINDTLVARGEVIVEGGKYGVRVQDIVNRKQRLQSLN